MFIGWGLFVLGAIFLTIVAPIWIIAHYVTHWRASRKLSSADEKALGELWQSAQRMEARIQTLERILDSEAPGWRMRAGG
jgi:phage shock protein B